MPGHSFAALDFGRGVWPLNSHWTRAAFATVGGIAGNFGAGWTDASGETENALWFGGELSRLNGPVHLRQGPENGLSPWQLSSDCERVRLTFTPRQLHQAIRAWARSTPTHASGSGASTGCCSAPRASACPWTTPWAG